MRYQNWNLARPNPEGRAALERQGVHPLLAAVLSARGITSLEQARATLMDSAMLPLDGTGMKDMDRAVARVRMALNRGETVAVYGDYDVDGITATCLLADFLSGLGCRVIPYIPDRLEEGYGLNPDAIASLAQQGVTLIVTVDCGITATEEVARAKDLGIDVVITDHHACKDQLPDAAAVVDPCRPDCPYPFKGLAGVGVALKLAMSLAGPEGEQEVLNRYCDLAAIGTVADVMPMTGENRAIVQRGLRALEGTRRLGLAKLVEEAGMGNRPLNSISIGYALAPRINAAGRMGRAQAAVELLLCRDPEQATVLAQELCRLNRDRQAVERDIFEQCKQTLAHTPQTGAILLADPSWHQGVVGIVASRLAEQYNCPAIMICLSGGMGKASCRSCSGINLFAVLEQCRDLLEAFGGHELAAGFTVKEENIPALAQRIRTLVASQAAQSKPSELKIDAQVDDPSMLDLHGVSQLDLLEPYGTGNPRPVLLLSGAQILGRSLVGGGRHLKLKLAKRGTVLDAILFSSGSALPDVGSRIDAAFYLQINEYRGAHTVQLQLLDLRPALSRAQMERDLYERFRRGEPLSAAEAGCLLPERDEFAALWRYLKRQTAVQPVLTATPAHISRDVARLSGRPEIAVHTLVCLDVLEQQGLISLRREKEQVQICLNPVKEKVSLEDCDIMRRLRQLQNLN